MIGDVYRLRSMRWQVASIFQRNEDQWAKLKCLDKRKKAWEVPVVFLEVKSDRRVS